MKSTIIKETKEIDIPVGTLLVYRQGQTNEYYVLTTKKITSTYGGFEGTVVAKGITQPFEIGYTGSKFVLSEFEVVTLPITIKYEN